MGAIPTSCYMAELRKEGQNRGDLWWLGMKNDNGEVLQEEDIVGPAQSGELTRKLAGLDWEVAKEPVFLHTTPRKPRIKVRVTRDGHELFRHDLYESMVQENGPVLETKFEGAVIEEVELQDAELVQFIEVPKHRAILRKDTGKVLGMVTEDFQEVQNHKCFELADQMAGDGEILYESALALWDGAFVCMLARIPEPAKVLGDDFYQYFLFYNWHNGAGSIGGCFTPVRVVCENTYQAAVESSERQFKLRHSTNVEERLNYKAKLLMENRKYMAKVSEEAERLVKIPISEQKWETIVNTLIQIPFDATEAVVKSRETQRFGLQQTIHTADLENFRWTGWGVVQAVSAFVNHAPPQRKQKNWAQNRFHNNWVRGNQMINDAIHLVLAIGE
jgi:phage/plasmid-like protein (TIGR03299 family)